MLAFSTARCEKLENQILKKYDKSRKAKVNKRKTKAGIKLVIRGTL